MSLWRAWTWADSPRRPSTRYQDYQGELVFKEVTGDFVATTHVTITDRDDIGGSDDDDVPGDSHFSLGGVMLRTPRDITDATTEWTPGGANFVFLSLGHGYDSASMSLESKNTQNSVSSLELIPVIRCRWTSASGWMLITRLGSVHLWTGAYASSPEVARLDSRYHEEPGLLVNAAHVDNSAIVSGGQLQISVANGYLGLLHIRLTASGGIEPLQQLFALEVTAPAWAGMVDAVFAEGEI